jgi:short-subunit dehydrogenase
MTPRNRGRIVQVGSALAYRGIPLQSAYCAAKHAVQGFCDSLRRGIASRQERDYGDDGAVAGADFIPGW